ncbi:MAG TPA: LytTR family DNA-binding domain-containing protein [Saprospiraceae bacterium]|nr:LytTR family DNA-binding domain-containing protein [Saprospiraceae bacterium]
MKAKITSILIDDEPRGLTSLQKLLEINCPEVEVLRTCMNAEEAQSAIAEIAPDLIFLDIAMPGKSGLDLLRELQEIRFETIFVTAHNNYAVQALQLSAVDYLLKPVDEDLLITAVGKAKKKIEEKAGHLHIDTFLHNMQQSGAAQKMKLCIPSMKGFQVVEIADIIYCEASSNYTNFHFTNRSMICASKPIHEYETLLEDSNFVRIHKSYVVNLEHVKEYLRGEGGSVVLTSGREVEVSRRKKELLMRRMKEHFKF